MDTQTQIDVILKANKLSDVVDIIDFEHNCKNILKILHPDVCKLPKATDAFQRLVELRDLFKTGTKYIDESGTYITNGFFVKFSGDHKSDLLKKSHVNYQKFLDKKDVLFNKYIPSTMGFNKGNYEITFHKRALPISGLSLSQEHVNWVLSRLLEYCVLLERHKMTHLGLHPESVFIVPETHGIKVSSFYHATPLGEPVKTISGLRNYYSWYPIELLVEKKANIQIDIALSKRIASYLLGDVSGVGTKLKRTHNIEFVNFLIKQHNSTAKEVFMEYRELLDKNFKKQFFPLNI
jgi:hypothetical protein